MGRGRGKGKKLSITNHEEIAVSGYDEKVHVQKRRGRPQKLPKHNIDEEVEKVEDDGSDNTNNGVSNEGVKTYNATEHDERKRKRNSQAKEKSESIEVDGGGNESSKPNGFRHIGSRRKSKPCRAAGTGVLCK